MSDWEVLPECPSTRGHNTIYFARKRGCVCPRALVLKKAYNAERNALIVHRQIQASSRPRDITKVRDAEPPNLEHAACATPTGLLIVNQAIEQARACNLKLAQQLCNTPCPVRDACARWVLGAEVVPGSWGGVYGGLTPADRRKIAANREEVAA